MNGRRRFLNVMRYEEVDRPPYFEEGIREEVIEAWRRQGLPEEKDISIIFPSDRREEIQLDLDPSPKPRKWPTSRRELDDFRKLLNPDDPKRLTRELRKQLQSWKNRDFCLMPRVHRGFFQSMGVFDWSRFADVVLLLMDDPEFTMKAMAVMGEFTAGLMDRVLNETDVDAAVFSEPIGGNDRPLISPKMYEEFVLRSYEPLLEVLHRHKVETIIFRTYANARLLIPSILKWGFNCLWACEVNIQAMDYRDLRREFGADLRLIGGIDVDVLRSDREAIRREVEEKVPPLLADGGYVPLADGRIRADVPYDNYVYYRQLLDKVIEDQRKLESNVDK